MDILSELRQKVKFLTGKDGNNYYKESDLIPFLKLKIAASKNSRADLSEEQFLESINPFIETYGKDMCMEFYDYWSERTIGGKKMRFQLEKTWDVSKRLLRWSKNNFAKPEKGQEVQKRKFKQL